MRRSRRSSADWIAVYGDREHFANLTFLCGFDPRFEEALLPLSRTARILVVGLEGLTYADLLPVALDVRLCPTFGLMGRDRSAGQPLYELLADAGIARGQTVGVVGWKSLERGEWRPRCRPSPLPHSSWMRCARSWEIPRSSSTPRRR